MTERERLRRLFVQNRLEELNARYGPVVLEDLTYPCAEVKTPQPTPVAGPPPPPADPPPPPRDTSRDRRDMSHRPLLGRGLAEDHV